MMRSTVVVSIFLMLVSCASARQEQALQGRETLESEEMLTRIRTLVFEGDQKVVR